MCPSPRLALLSRRLSLPAPLSSRRPSLPVPSLGPALRLTPATPLVGEQGVGRRPKDDLTVCHHPKGEQAITIKVDSGYLKWQDEANPRGLPDSKSNMQTSSTPRTASACSTRATDSGSSRNQSPAISRSNTQTSGNPSGRSSSTRAANSGSSQNKSPMVSRSNTYKSSLAPSVKSSKVGGWRARNPLVKLRRSSSDRAQSKRGSIKIVKKMSTVVKADSVKSVEPCETSQKGSSSFFSGKSSKSTRKNSFYRVMDKLRGMGRRPSQVTTVRGQGDFLSSLSAMSDSRIVENWLLSLDEKSAAPVETEEVLEETEVLEASNSFLKVSESSSEDHGGITPTNEMFENERKAGDLEVQARRTLFNLPSSEDDDSLAEEAADKRRPMSAPPARAGFRRQVSENESEYTTDTHDTGETAQVTARNTKINTLPSFTNEGDEIRKGGIQPSFRPISFTSTVIIDADEEVAAINMERLELDSQKTSRSSETTQTCSSSQPSRRPSWLEVGGRRDSWVEAPSGKSGSWQESGSKSGSWQETGFKKVISRVDSQGSESQGITWWTAVCIALLAIRENHQTKGPRDSQSGCPCVIAMSLTLSCSVF